MRPGKTLFTLAYLFLALWIIEADAKAQPTKNRPNLGAAAGGGFPNTQPLSLVIIKNLLKSSVGTHDQKVEYLLKNIRTRDVDFDFTPEIEFELAADLLAQRFELNQIEKIIRGLKLIEAETKFRELTGVLKLARNPMKLALNEEELNIFEKMSDLVELYLSSENPLAVGKIYNLRGNIYLQKKNYDKSISELLKAINVGFKGASTNQMLGEAYIAKGNFYRENRNRSMAYYRRAIGHLTEAIRFDPNNAELLYIRAQQFRKIGEYERARQDLEKYNFLNGNLLIN